MNERYKIIIFGRNLYKEIECAPNATVITVGTDINADVRLRKELFFGTINLSFSQTNGCWSVVCSDNLYFNLGDTRKLINMPLEHGSEASLCYQGTGNEALCLEFVLDFDYEKQDYKYHIDLTNLNRIKIGGAADSHIYISDELIGHTGVELYKNSQGYTLVDLQTTYGVLVNGKKITGNAQLQDMDFFSLARYSFYLRKNCLYFSSSSNIFTRSIQVCTNDQQTSFFEYPKFQRNTRIQYSINEDELEIQQPPAKPGAQKKNIVLTIIPTIIMLAMTIILRGIIGGGGTFVIYSSISMGVGIVMSIVTYILDKRTYKKDLIEREKNYQQYIISKIQVIRESRANELTTLQKIYTSLSDSVNEALNFGRHIFERDFKDKDFLQIYLGEGRIESANQVKFAKQEFVDISDPISELPQEVHDEYSFIENAPIVSDFRDSNGIGVVGNTIFLMEFLKNITLDLSIRHFYNDVKIAYLLGENYINEFEWVKWLRNVENNTLDIRNIAYDSESINILLEHLYAILSERENMLKSTQDSKGFKDNYIVFVTDSSRIGTYPISRYFSEASKYGFTFVFLDEHEENIPQGCDEIIKLNAIDNGELIKTTDGDRKTAFRFKNTPTLVAEQVALKLGAVYVDEVSLEGQLTQNITMFELLNIMSVDDLDLEKRWKESQVYKTIAAPIGVKRGGEVVALDISDKAGAHGPHGLVAGTTGSGKSEILQTYILSIATLFHPYDVGFVIIDFKGGGMANQFARLPHLIGTITNIDGREIDRSLLSIKAELVKRQEMFSAAGVNHINDYIKLFKKGEVSTPMPHLIMIVDEFAELKAEYPDFMKELISAARIGRTLGVHLILATQKPAGVVDAQIWSNSKFKLCLKVQTKEDSNEVLKTPLAAEIVEPGRAYFQVGNNEIFELIQSAYSGAGVPEGNNINEKVFNIYERNLWGKKKLIYTNKKKKNTNDSETQLEAIVSYVDLFCKASSIDRLPGICLPAMPITIGTEALDYGKHTSGFMIPIGIYDDPGMQKQGFVELDVSRDNTYVVGSAQMGKTVLLQTLAYGLIKQYTPKQVNIYMIDCGSMVLKIFENSNHVGGVVLSTEEEKCKNLFKLLNKTIVERKKILSSRGVGNFAAYLEAGCEDLPLIVVIIDNMAAFKEYFPDQSEQINSLTREALGVGISFVITAATSNALNYRTQANFGKKLVLNCNDTGEYSNVFGHCRQTPSENPGRGLYMLDKRILEMQIAMFGGGKKEAERSDAIKAFVLDRNNQSNDKAKPIPMVPEKLVLDNEMKIYPEIFRNEKKIPIGMEFATVEYLSVDLLQVGSFSLMGDSESRLMFVKAFLNILKRNIVFHNVEAIVIDDKQKSLAETESFGFVKQYTNNVAEGMAYIRDFIDEIDQREDADDYIAEMSTIMLVINNAELLKQILADKNTSKELASIVKRINGSNAFVLFAGIDNSPVGFNSPDLLKTLKEERQGILFAPLTDNRLYETSGRIKADNVFDKTMGYRFDSRGCTKIKIFE